MFKRPFPEQDKSQNKKSRLSSWLWPFSSPSTSQNKQEPQQESQKSSSTLGNPPLLETQELLHNNNNSNHVFTEPLPVKRNESVPIPNVIPTTPFTDRVYSPTPMSISSRTSMVSGSSLSSSWVKKRSTGFKLVDRMKEQERKDALNYMIQNTVPFYTEAREGGFFGSEQDYQDVVNYASMVFKHVEMQQMEKVVHVDLEIKEPSTIEPFEQVKWIKDLRERILKTLKTPANEFFPTISTPTYDKLVSTRKDLDESIKRLREPPAKPAFPPLTEEMEVKISQLLSPGAGLVVSGFNVDLQKHDIHTLKAGVWLNDEIINFYGQLIMERARNNSSRYPDIHIFNTFFYTNLKKGGYDKVKRWSKKFDVFAKAYIIIPVHLGMHWVCSVINLKKKRFEYYDSLHGGGSMCLNIYKILRDYLVNESKTKKGMDLNLDEWVDYIPKNIPAQQNGYDCGVFTSMFMEYIASELDFDFTQKQMNYFRRRMAWEISQKTLLRN